MKRGLLHHVEIYVSDLKQSVNFWGWLLEELGYHRFQEWTDGVSWKLDDTYLVFVQTREEYLAPTYHRCRVGLNHLAFSVSSQQELETFKDRLLKQGVKMLYDGRTEANLLFFEDPDRIKVELVVTS